jgi:DNA-binding response OmpR family regulator
MAAQPFRCSPVNTWCLMTTKTPAAGATRVLVIDDNREAADTLSYLLCVWGYDARAAYGGEEGLRAAQECRPRCVICDLAMPQVSGFEVARRMRSGSLLAGAFLVALTGFGSDEFRSRAAEAGFDRYLVKPAEPEEVRALLGMLPPPPGRNGASGLDHG